jgi:hypothetical protein
MNKTLSKIIHAICEFLCPGCFQSQEQPVKQVQQLAPLKEEVITEPVQCPVVTEPIPEVPVVVPEPLPLPEASVSAPEEILPTPKKSRAKHNTSKKKSGKNRK